MNLKLFLISLPLLLLLLCCPYTSIAEELPVLIEELPPPPSYSSPIRKGEQEWSETALAPLQLRIGYRGTTTYFIGFSTNYKF